MLRGTAWLGIALATVALCGFSDQGGWTLYLLVWGLLWLLYLSFVNLGQTFYSFGWESLLLETGFLAIFLGPADTGSSLVIIWLLRWVLFRIMLGAGLIKWRGDPCWRDLTCLYYHYETQPMPNALSWYLHHLPKLVHRLGVQFKPSSRAHHPLYLVAATADFLCRRCIDHPLSADFNPQRQPLLA